MMRGLQTRSEAHHFEPRWPVALAIFVVIILFAALPQRIRLLPALVTYIVGFGVLVPILAVGLTAAKPRWLRIERTVTLIFVVFSGSVTLINLGNLIAAMLYRSAEVGGLQLLATSVAVWVSNALIFSLLYWQIDRGGPEARITDASARPDWLFPQEGAPTADVPRGWEPTFVDYLYLGYSTATAFSTTDAMPLTPRAKLLMMLESAISLVTVIVVAARAINILGSQ
jgi:uncharacterized membrane protein